MTTFISSLIQVIGGAFLVVVCATLYAYRRRAYFLFWTGSWLCFCALLFLAPKRAGSGGVDWEGAALAGPLNVLASIFGWWHSALWCIGMLDFRRRRLTPGQLAGALVAAALVAIASAWALPYLQSNLLLALVIGV